MNNIIGADEAGTGAWAGPFVVCAVFLTSPLPKEFRDSKKVSPGAREHLAARMEEMGVPYVLGFGWHQDIDKYGMGPTLMTVYNDVLTRARRWTQHARIIVDGSLNLGPDVQCIPKADASVSACSAASILAKVTRDRMMRHEIHPAHPQYGFYTHKGYGTEQHVRALQRHGPCDAHRMSYRPLKEYRHGSDLQAASG